MEKCVSTTRTAGLEALDEIGKWRCARRQEKTGAPARRRAPDTPAAAWRGSAHARAAIRARIDVGTRGALRSRMNALVAGLVPMLALVAMACGGTTVSSAGDACAGAPTACDDGCGGTYAATCSSTGWACGYTGACATDASDDGDVSTRDSATFACGAATCDVASQYCSESGGGAQLPDAGSNFSETCEALPAECAASPTCACVNAATNNGCPCTTNGGGVTVECLYP